MKRCFAIWLTCALALCGSSVAQTGVYDQTVDGAWSGGGEQFTVSFTGTPTPLADGVLMFRPRDIDCDLDGGTEWVDIFIEGVPFGSVFEEPGYPSLTVPETIVIPRDQLATFAADGRVDVLVVPTGAAGQCRISAELLYQVTHGSHEFELVAAAGDRVLRFGFTGTGPLIPQPPILATSFNTPSVPAYRSNGELLVSNTHGNIPPSGSISRFVANCTDGYSPNGVMTSNLVAVHQLVFRANGELLAPNGAGTATISRFLFDANGTAQFNGVIPSPGGAKGLAISGAGELFVVDGVTTTVHRYRFDPNDPNATPSPNGSFVVPGAQSLHFPTFSSNGELFVPDIVTNEVYRYLFDGSGNPLPNGQLAVPVAIGAAFSPTGELFVSGHYPTGGITRFLFDPNGNAIANGFVPTSTLSGIAISRWSSGAPTITLQPSNSTECSGGSATFTVAAVGAGTLSFQWYRGPTPLADGGNTSGATTPALTLNPVTPGDVATDYNVVVSNACGPVTSNNASLQVLSQPVQIVAHPAHTLRSLGAGALLAVAATGDAPLSYQWRRYGVALTDGPTGSGSTIAGATTSQLSIQNVGPADAAAYDVIVSNPCSTTTSRGAFLTLTPSCAVQQPIPMLLVANKNADNVAAISIVSGLSIRPVAEAPGKLDYANGLAVNLAGKAFVSSAANGRVQRFDLRNRELEQQFSGGGLGGPVDVILRPSTLLVSSYGTNQIKEYNLDTGLWIRNLVAAGSGGLSGPTGLFARLNGNLLVCSEDSSEVLEYDAAGAFVRVAASGGGLDVPNDVLLDPAGNVLVSSFATDSVKKYDANGAYVGDFVTSGSGGLDGAGGLCWSPAGNLWVCSRFTSQILEYDGQTGAFVRVFSSGSHLSEPTYMAVVYLCDPDCNGNGILDQWDLELGRDCDCDQNGVPDECQNIVPSGTAAALDGVDDYLTAGAGSGLNLLNNFTIEAWIRPSALAAEQRIVSNGYFSLVNPNEVNGYGFGSVDGRALFSAYGVRDYHSTASLAPDRWTHVVAAMSAANNVRFYVNGSPAGQVAGTGPIRPSTHPFNIGRNPTNEPDRQQHFGGLIDEVRIWNRVRTDAEILAEWKAPLQGNEPNLVAYWRFNEAEGPTALDSAGSNHATRVGAQWAPSGCAFVACMGDANDDGVVNQDDLDIVLFNFALVVPPNTNGDLDGDGVVTQDDMDLVLFEFGLLCL